MRQGFKSDDGTFHVFLIRGIDDVEPAALYKCFGVAVAECLVTAVIAAGRKVRRRAAAQQDGLVEHRSVSAEKQH